MERSHFARPPDTRPLELRDYGQHSLQQHNEIFRGATQHGPPNQQILHKTRGMPASREQLGQPHHRRGNDYSLKSCTSTQIYIVPQKRKISIELENYILCRVLLHRSSINIALNTTST